MKNILDVSTEKGDVEVSEEDLATVTDAELKKAGINMTREELRELFAEGVKIMRAAKVRRGIASDRWRTST